ncbi:MAG: hypothetical protein J2P32_17150 [Actinobacteria bacterium]|nr:hypothetical protein [Actinomycetota bacterium]
MTTRTSQPAATRQRSAGVRHGIDIAYGYLAGAFVLGVLLQVYFAALGIFGINARKVADASSFDPHRAWGTVLMITAVVLLILALAAWQSRATVIGTFVLAVLVVVAQSLLASAGDSNKWVGGLHGLDGMIILLLSVWLAVSAWRRLRGRGAGPGGSAARDGHEV